MLIGKLAKFVEITCKAAGQILTHDEEIFIYSRSDEEDNNV